MHGEKAWWELNKNVMWNYDNSELQTTFNINLVTSLPIYTKGDWWPPVVVYCVMNLAIIPLLVSFIHTGFFIALNDNKSWLINYKGMNYTVLTKFAV